jgi:hypothetical protein
MKTKFPQPETVTPTTPLRLEVAARLGFPDGSMSASALRRLAVSGQLDHERIAGKLFVTLNAISEMRSRCHVPAKAPGYICPKPKKGDNDCGSSVMVDRNLALDAMNMIASEAKKPSQNTSPKSTTRKKP